MPEDNENINPYSQPQQDYSNYGQQWQSPYEEQPGKRKGLGLVWNIILFVLTFFSTTLAGVGWLNKDPFNLNNFHYGIKYSILILFVLSCHEFGHYFAAKIHKVKVTLPFYIPFPFIFLNPFGTMGAVIRMKSPSRTRKALFDIGIAGPVSGFIASLLILVWGMTHLPPFEYIFSIHPEYISTGVPLTGFTFGNTLLYWGLGKLLTSSPSIFLPPMNEMYHYPFLCVGWFGLLVTALNLLPVGQLDGGHIAYSLLGNKHKFVARLFFGFTFAMGLIGLAQLLLSEFAGIIILGNYGFLNWLIWAILMFFIVKIDHPPLYDPEPIGLKRKLWGVFALFMFVTSFTPVPVSNF